MTSKEIVIGGSYRLGKRIGGGSFGEIFLGIDTNTGEEVAIKIVSLPSHV